MKVTIAIDSFKGSLSSMEAGEACKEGIKRVYPDAEVYVCPLADGGEGTAYALTEGMGGQWITIDVTGPLDKPVKCGYGMIMETKTAIMEMAQAAGITLLTAKERNPLNTTTYGVGEMIIDAINRGCRSFIIGIGGSATNDGGIGMLQALGYGILDKDGKQVSHGAKGLAEIASITADKVNPALSECSFKIACDVTNPLCGDNGASVIYGPQKGADAEMIRLMDKGLSDFADLVHEKYPNADKNYPGTGAAGGLGFAFLSFTNARLQPGVKIVIDETELESYVKDSNIVITGEGRLDAQTVMGKAPSGVAEIAKKYDKTVIAFSGCIADDAGRCNDAGIDAFFPILRTVTTLDEAMDIENAKKNMSDTSEQVFRLYQQALRSRIV